MEKFQNQPNQAPEIGDVYGSFMGGPEDVNAAFTDQYAQIGSIEEGAPVIDELVAQYIGDLESDFEDGDLIDASELVGDIEVGGPKRRARRKSAKAARAARKLRKAGGSTQAKLAAERTLAGKINPSDLIPFVSAQGMVIQTITQFPAGSTFVAEQQRTCVDLCQLQGPGVGIVVSTTTPATQFGTTLNANEFAFYPFIVIKVGVNLLNGIAGTIVTFAVSLPNSLGVQQTLNFTAQMTDKFNGTVVIYPYQLVAGRPQPVLGRAGGTAAATTDEILVTITGLPANQSSASLIVPQSAYPLFIAYRNALA